MHLSASLENSSSRRHSSSFSLKSDFSEAQNVKEKSQPKLVLRRFSFPRKRKFTPESVCQTAYKPLLSKWGKFRWIWKKIRNTTDTCRLTKKEIKLCLSVQLISKDWLWVYYEIMFVLRLKYFSVNCFCNFVQQQLKRLVEVIFGPDCFLTNNICLVQPLFPPFRKSTLGKKSVAQAIFSFSQSRCKVNSTPCLFPDLQFF